MGQTRTQLVHRALRNLGALPQGQNPSDEEFDSVNDLIKPLLAKLHSMDIVTVRDPNNVDDDVFLSVGHLLADAARSEFGSLGNADAQELAALAEKAKMDLKIIKSRNPTYATLRADYF